MSACWDGCDAVIEWRCGWQDGKADRPPNVDRMALGANRLNDYEIGYLDSGMGDVPQRWPEGWAIPNVARDA